MKIVLLSGQDRIPENESCLTLYLFRHGNTRYNLEKRYQGRTDLELLEEEKERIRPAWEFISQRKRISGQEFAEQGTPALGPDFIDHTNRISGQEVVYVSPALRARQTASLLFPGMEQVLIPEFREMDFGRFEGLSADEMQSDPLYRRWIDSMCEGTVPDGESRAQFCRRVTKRFEMLAGKALSEKKKRLLIVAHGGVQMAVMERFSEERRPYWTWQTPPGEALVATICRKRI